MLVEVTGAPMFTAADQTLVRAANVTPAAGNQGIVISLDAYNEKWANENTLNAVFYIGANNAGGFMPTTYYNASITAQAPPCIPTTSTTSTA
jgi:hypothetical protein